MRDVVRKTSGFTLIELLAAVTLMVVLGTMLFTIFQNSSVVVREASGRQMVFQQAKLFMDHIERETAGAFTSASARATGMRPFLVLNQGHFIGFVTAAKVRDTRDYFDLAHTQPNPNFGTEANLGRVGYYLGDGTTTLGDGSKADAHTLYRFEYYTLYTAGGPNDDPNEARNASAFINNVVSFTVECYDPPGANGRFYVMDWDSSARGTLPKAVRITLRLTDDAHLKDYNGLDDNADGVIDDFNETQDTIGQTFEHVAYIGNRTW
jgi:prepilin-type N-terminal cleavage/methylation domain-containing protein